MILVKRSSFENVKTRYESLPSSNLWRTSTVFCALSYKLPRHLYLLAWPVATSLWFSFRIEPAVRIVKTFSLQFFLMPTINCLTDKLSSFRNFPTSSWVLIRWEHALLSVTSKSRSTS